MRHFCTLFDRNYLWKGLCLHASLVRHAPAFQLHVLCMDDLTRTLLARLALPSVSLIAIEDFEDEALRRVKPTRSAGEYCWTCTPSLPLHVLETTLAADRVTYLDADLFFYSSPEPAFAETGESPVAIHAHAFPPRLAHLEREAGTYNVGWVSFRRDEVGLACLRRWRDQCLEWCFGRFEDGRLGDQKYLEEWPSLYAGLHVLRHPGVGVGPWNVESLDVSRAPDGSVRADGEPLVFFHFHGFHLHEEGPPTFAAEPPFRLSRSVRELVYEPYVAALASARERVATIEPGFRSGLVPRPASLSWPRRSYRRVRSDVQGWLAWLGAGSAR